ncbi:2,3-diaminopropionate biosynthesis protein SbnA [Burkholderia gladioli]|nr:2,3-diaminopropionate biosynthesis protein SbnA [Burkholderia gladioli]
MIITSPVELVFDDLFLQLGDWLEQTSVHLKLEGYSLSGSIKIKAALQMIEGLERAGRLAPGRAVIESSSGNLGLALAVVCAIKGYPFTCVSDPNISPQTARLIEAYGASLVVVKQRDENGGFLGTRIRLIRDMLERDSGLVWLNQYGNLDNIEAHRRTTGPAILRQFAAPDYVFVGAGTTGTLGGVSGYLRQHAPRTRIVAVDSVGSVTFGTPPGTRHIPGLGTSEPPEIRCHASFDELVMVPEADAVTACHALARQGLLLGGSSGTVLAGIRQYAHRIEPGACVVAISPDLGDRYVDTLYNPDWVASRYPSHGAARAGTRRAAAVSA